jgi:uncharacterized membrane protein
MSVMAFTELLQIINTGGTLALLVFFVWAFYNGEIISKKVLDKIIESYRQQTEDTLERSMQKLISEIRKKGW